MKIAVAGATGRVGRHAVDVLKEGGHDVVAISRSHGVDVVTGQGLAGALTGVASVIDAATGASRTRRGRRSSSRTPPGTSSKRARAPA